MEINIVFHYPHDRLAIGWEYISPDKKFDYSTVVLFCLFMTIKIDW